MKKKQILLLTALLIVAAKASSTSATTLPSSAMNCTATINAGEDQIVCSQGATANLAVTVNGTPRSFSWSPANLLNDPTVFNPIATIDASTTFEVTVRALSNDNLIFNGDFEQGNVGFTSAYIPGTGGNNGLLTNEGQYAIDDNSMDTHRRFASCSDHSGSGNMMVINASGTTDNIWCQNISVTPNTAYDFSAWVSTVEVQNPARLQFSINGSLLGGIFNASSSTCLWQQFFASWDAGNNTSADICIVNVNLNVTGNDFAIDDISFREVCVLTDEVRVDLADINADWTSPGTLCQNVPTFVLDELLDGTATAGGEWLIDGVVAAFINPAMLSIGTHQLNYRITQGNCTVELPQDIIIIGSPQAGVPAAPDRFCSNFDNPVDLSSLLSGADPGGSWSEVSPILSSGNAFNSAMGRFNTIGQAAGNYIFTYAVTGPTGCPAATAEVSVIVQETPVADAGNNLQLDCVTDFVVLGGPNLSLGSGLQYQWSKADGSIVPMGNTPFPEVSTPGSYLLKVSNLTSGCSSTDGVEVIERITNINATASTSPISCSATNDGAITIGQVIGGDAPYLYALNDGPFTAQSQFGNLGAGSYQITVMDVNGCEKELLVNLEAPEPLTAKIIAKHQNSDDPVIGLGDSIQLQVLLSKDETLQSLSWNPAQDQCPGCLSIWVSPTETTNYQIKATDSSACSATASLTIRVDKKPRIFIPNAFSPNNDGKNDFLVLNASGNQVNQINSFQVLDRWGNLLFQQKNFNPNDEAYGWDGFFKGQRVNAGVYIYFAEMTLSDGSLYRAQGEVNVIY
ncbi:MAG: gliding motility-associated C-terminal domain-containing protein [Saprospiraceae bacterium]